MSKEVKEPAVRMIKRDTISTAKAWGIRLAAVALSLIVAGLVIVAITKQNPIQVYLGIIDGAVGSSRRVWVTIRETLVLLCIAIGLTPAFKMKFWNIGAEGQILMGGMATAALMIYAGDAMPNWLLLILIFIASAAAGLIWGLIPAVFKASSRCMTEVRVSIMWQCSLSHLPSYSGRIRPVLTRSASSMQLDRKDGSHPFLEICMD